MSVFQERPTNGSKRRRLGLVVTAVTALGMPLAATSAFAVGISNPPVLPHSIISFPARDFVSAAGYAAVDRPIVQVVRAGTVVGFTLPVTPQDDPKTVGFDGLVDVNHPGGACWEGVTPSIQAGDVIQVLTAAGTGDQTTTANVTVTQNATSTVAGTITIKGNAIAPAGGQIPIDQLDIRMVANQQAFLANGRRTLRADSLGVLGGADGTLVYDGPGLTTWTATFPNLVAADVATGVGSESRVLWLGVNTATGQELTIYEAGGPTPATKGPAAPCGGIVAPTPSIPDMSSATDMGLSSLDNVTKNARPNFVGVTGDPAATRATLFVDDVVNASAAVVGGRYSLTPSAVLTNGTHTIKVSETAPAAPDALSKGFLSVRIDTVAPIITRVAPVVNQLGVKRLANVAAIFNESVNHVAGNTFALRKWSTHGLLTSAVSYAATTHIATLNPSTTLLANTVYQVTLASPLMDTAGNTLVAKVYNFKTGAAL